MSVQSKEIRKHVLRSLQENARQGFWNGSQPPYGYRTVATEQRGVKVKKRLAIDPIEAETVRLIFRLLTEGDGTSGPMGIKATASWLNSNGDRTRKGSRIGEQLLTQDRVAALLHGLVERQLKRDEDATGRMTALRGKLAEA